MAADIKREVKLEIVHVLFLDIVGYSKALTDEQQELIDRLNQAVRGSRRVSKGCVCGSINKNSDRRWNGSDFLQQPGTTGELRR
jgi:hypothetical protein